MTDPRPAAAPAALRGAILEELQRGVPSVYWHIDPLLELIRAREADTVRQLAEAHEEIVRLKGERDAAREALRPFEIVGRLIDRFMRGQPDGAPFQSGCAWQSNGVKRTLTWGDFRRAVLAASGDGG